MEGLVRNGEARAKGVEACPDAWAVGESKPKKRMLRCGLLGEDQGWTRVITTNSACRPGTSTFRAFVRVCAGEATLSEGSTADSNGSKIRTMPSKAEAVVRKERSNEGANVSGVRVSTKKTSELRSRQERAED